MHPHARALNRRSPYLRTLQTLCQPRYATHLLKQLWSEAPTGAYSPTMTTLPLRAGGTRGVGPTFSSMGDEPPSAIPEVSCWVLGNIVPFHTECAAPTSRACEAV